MKRNAGWLGRVAAGLIVLGGVLASFSIIISPLSGGVTARAVGAGPRVLIERDGTDGRPVWTLEGIKPEVLVGVADEATTAELVTWGPVMALPASAPTPEPTAIPTPTPTPEPTAATALPMAESIADFAHWEGIWRETIEAAGIGRRIDVTSEAELRAVFNDLRGGDWIVVHAGTYTNLSNGYKKPPGLSAERPIVFDCRDATFTSQTKLLGVPHAKIFGAKVRMEFGTGTAFRFDQGTHHVSLIGCRTYGVPAVLVSNQNSTSSAQIGHFRFAYCHFQGPGAELGSLAGYVVAFSSGRAIGDDNVLEYCNLTEGWDGFSTGESGGDRVPLDKGLIIRGNRIWRCADDGIQAEGNHGETLISRNVIGGTRGILQCALALAPGGPGPFRVTENSFAGYRVTGVKVNTEADGATVLIILERCQLRMPIDQSDPLKTPARPYYFALYFSGGTKLARYEMHDCTVTGPQALLVTEAITLPAWGLSGNRWWSDGSGPWSPGTWWRLWDPAGNRNVYYKDYAAFAEAAGETGGSFGPVADEPGQVYADVPIEELADYRVSGN